MRTRELCECTAHPMSTLKNENSIFQMPGSEEFTEDLVSRVMGHREEDIHSMNIDAWWVKLRLEEGHTKSKGIILMAIEEIFLESS